MGRRSNAQTRARYGVDTDGWDGEPIQQAARLTLTPAVVAIALPGSEGTTVKLYLDGAPVVGATITAVSTDVGVATVTVFGITDSNGETSLTITGVAAGSCNIEVGSAGANPSNVLVTVTGP
jgi:hypothetical protein